MSHFCLFCKVEHSAASCHYPGHAQLVEMLARAEKAEAENTALREALRHQRNALVIVRDRQGGGASIDDINQGIRQIDAALAAQEKP